MAGKPKPPKLDLETLQFLKDAVDEPSAIYNRFSQLNSRNKEGTINTAFIAFEAIGAFLELYDIPTARQYIDLRGNTTIQASLQQENIKAINPDSVKIASIRSKNYILTV